MEKGKKKHNLISEIEPKKKKNKEKNILNCPFLLVHNELICLLLQVNNAGASGVVVDEEGLRALNIDPSTWVLLHFL